MYYKISLCIHLESSIITLNNARPMNIMDCALEKFAGLKCHTTSIGLSYI